MSAASGTLRAAISTLTDGPVVMPGVGTALEAQCAVAAGFESVYLSGYAAAAWGHGLPDVGLTALAERSATLSEISDATGIPVMCDADTGYGGVANVAHTVRQLERRGAQAIQLEDQTWPKRCGHLEGKTVIPTEEHARNITAAVLARQDPDTLIVARTDALAPNGIRDALDRAKRYADAGADLLFVDAPTSIADLETIANEIPDQPLVANMSESGLTPHLAAKEFYELGFSVVLFPTSALRIAVQAVLEFFGELRSKGDSREWTARMATLEQLNALVGLPDLERWADGIPVAAQR